MIESALEGWIDLHACRFLFIENVGNLVCPSSYDLGEAMRVVLLSVTEGEDKPLKYPTIYHTSDLALLTKIDLAEVVAFNRQAALANLEAVRPGMKAVEVSSRTGQGMPEWLDLLRSRSTGKIGETLLASDGEGG